jgi:hypothetical protein
MAWQIGEDIPVTVTFADLDGNLFDPQTSVTFEYKNPVTDTVTVFTWTVAVPGTDIEKLSLGTFRALFRGTHKGFYHWIWTGEGDPKRIIQSEKDTAIEVEANVF